MIKRIISVIIVAVMCLLCFTCCGKDTGTDKNIVYPIDNDPVYLDPQIAKDKGALTIINNIFEGLVRLDKNGNITEGVASSWKISDDKLTYTFNLRQNARWLVTKTASSLYFSEDEQNKSFEEKLTADDFIFAFRRAVDKATNASYASRLFCIENAYQINKGSLSSDNLGVTKQDDYTLKIRLEYPNDDFLKVLTTCICMPCNEKLFNLTKGRYGLSNQYLIYNGPYYISSWEEDSHITISENESYVGKTKQNPSSIYFSINDEYNTRAKKLTQGTYDISPMIFSEYEQISGQKGLSFIEKENTVWAFVFNCNDEAMKNKNARLAISHGIDMSLLVQTDDFSRKATGIIPSSVFVGETSYRQNAGETVSLPYSTKKADRYWLKALDELSVRALSVTILCTSQHENEIRATLQNLQKAFGISCDVRVKVLEEKEILTNVSSGDFQIAYMPIKTVSDFALEMLTYCGQITSYNSKSFKSIIDEMYCKGWQSGINTILSCENMLIEDCVIIPAFFATEKTALGKGVSEFFYNNTGTVADFSETIKTD